MKSKKLEHEIIKLRKAGIPITEETLEEFEITFEELKQKLIEEAEAETKNLEDQFISLISTQRKNYNKMDFINYLLLKTNY